MNNQYSDINRPETLLPTDATFLRKDLDMEFQVHPAGTPFMSNVEPIIFQINNTHITLPIRERTVIGRASGKVGNPQPDVDLSAFEMNQKSVSRCHARIERRGALIYVTDLSSSNGTWLNGHKLIPNAARLLRDGDELCLGELKVKVKLTG